MPRLIAIIVMLIALVIIAPAQTRRPHFTDAFSKEEFSRRRARVGEAIGPKAIAVIRGNEDMPGSAEFVQNTTVFYLSGVEAPGAILLLDGKNQSTTLFLPPRNERREQSEGPVLIPNDIARELTGIDTILEAGAFTGVLARLASERDFLYVETAPQELEAMSRDGLTRYQVDRLNDPWDGRSSREAYFAGLLHARFPSFTVKDITPTLDKMRLIKSDEEIAALRKASELAALSLTEAMRSTQPGQYEYELDALGQFIYFRNGAKGLAYAALVASGRNAYFPHYRSGLSQMKGGELLLMDFAPDYHYYHADVTRMWPVNGKFLPQQVELYSFYLKCYQAILKSIRPYVAPRTIMAEAVNEMEQILRQTRFSEEKYRRGAENFVAEHRNRAERAELGRLGHWVGMTTHDVGGAVDVLKPGMVFTIEPALRVPEDEIYIRLEDMLLITATGVENLSALAPVEIDAIEALMKEPGLLERYPRHLAHDAVRPKRAALTRAEAKSDEN